MRPSVAFLLTLLPVLLLGCGGDAPAPTVPVTGRLTFEGKPVAGASIDFVPGEGRAPAIAITDENGEFELSTFSQGDGAVIGTHTVTVLPSFGAPKTGRIVAGQPSASKATVPTRYSMPEKTPLEFKVEKGKENHFEINMTKKGA